MCEETTTTAATTADDKHEQMTAATTADAQVIYSQIMPYEEIELWPD